MTSEDCLNLSIFTPALPFQSSNVNALPVAVCSVAAPFWKVPAIYQSMSGYARIRYGRLKSFFSSDGGNMASIGDVVVVSVKYRVGLLGNMASQVLIGSVSIQTGLLVIDHKYSEGGPA